MSEVEKRYHAALNVRATGNSEKRTISGYALKFGTWSEDLGGFIETIEPSALNEADMSDVRGLFDHDPQKILGRTKAGTLRLQADKIGLRFECDLPNTSYARDLFENILKGNVNNCSFGFILATGGDEVVFDSNKGIYRRTIQKIKRLTDVSVVTFPAYQDTDVAPALRNIKKPHEKKNRLEKEKLEIEMELLAKF